MGASGSWKTHNHLHIHDGDALHDHHSNVAVAQNQEADSDDIDATVSTQSVLALLPNYDVEARIAILRAAGRPIRPADDFDYEARVRIAKLRAAAPPLRAEQRRRAAEWEAERTVKKWRKRIEELKKGSSQ